MTLSLLCIAGPAGDAARATVPSNATLVWTMWARCHFEAMSLLHERIGPERYTSDDACDLESYSQALIDEQQAFLL